MCRFGGSCEGNGVSYRMDETAAGADHDGRASWVGRGWIRRWSALYASAEVEEVVCWVLRGKRCFDDDFGWRWEGDNRVGMEVKVRRAAIVA